MPSAVEDITNTGMRAMWEQDVEATNGSGEGPEQLD